MLLDHIDALTGCREIDGGLHSYAAS
jgi:hypothetical protein